MARKRQEVHEERAVLWTDRRVLAAVHLTQGSSITRRLCKNWLPKLTENRQWPGAREEGFLHGKWALC